MSKKYSITFKSKAKRQLKKLSLSVSKEISTHIDGLADNPRPAGVVKLKGRGKQIPWYRIRVGNYRVKYEIHDEVLLVLVVEVADRKDAY